MFAFIIVVQFTLCLWTSFSFELLLPSKCPWLCHRSTFAFKGHLLSSKGICRRRNSSCCHRRVIAVEGPLPSNGICHRRAFAIEGHLPSKGICHRRAFAIGVLCLQCALGFAIEGRCHRSAFAIDGTLSSKGLWLQSALAFAIEVPLP